MYTQRSGLEIDYDELIDKCDRVFVYGSLKKEGFNHSLLYGSTMLQVDRTKKPFVLGNVGYPYAFPEQVVPSKYKHLLFPVKGEVYKLDSDYTFAILDSLEGYPSHYIRTVVELESGLDAWMYQQVDWENNAKRCNACNLEGDTWVWH